MYIYIYILDININISMCFGKKPAVHSEGFKNIVEQNKQFLKQLFRLKVYTTRVLWAQNVPGPKCSGLTKARIDTFDKKVWRVVNP